MSNVTEETQVSTGFGDVLDTPEVKLPDPDPDAHRATIDGVTMETFDSGSVGVKIALTSQDQSSLSVEYTIFPPMDFVNNIHINPTTLSTIPPEGKKASAHQRYGQVVANSTKTAEFQRLRTLGYEAKGAEALQGIAAPESFEDYVGILSSLLTGVTVIFTRRPEKNEENPQFSGRLKVNGLRSIGDMNKPKAFKNYVRAWEQQ